MIKFLSLIFLSFLICNSSTAQHENTLQPAEVYKQNSVKQRMTAYHIPNNIIYESEDFNLNGELIKQTTFNSDGKPYKIVSREYDSNGILINETVTTYKKTILKTDTLIVDLELHYDSLKRIIAKEKTLEGKMIYQKIYTYNPLTEVEYLNDIIHRKVITVYERLLLEKSVRTYITESNVLTRAHESEYQNIFNDKGLLVKRKIAFKSKGHHDNIDRSLKYKGVIRYKYNSKGLFERINYSGTHHKKFTYQFY